MKIAVNRCFGGFSLSAEAIKYMAKLQNRKCYFYKSDLKSMTSITFEQAKKSFMWHAADIKDFGKKYYSMKSEKDFRKQNEFWEKHSFNERPENRTDPLLIKVIEELGEKASGSYANLEIIEIPDGVDYIIDEYDGMETVHEKHRSW